MNTNANYDKKRLIIIDLHCDPTIPAGANEAGGGNVYMRQLLHSLKRTEIPVTYITRKKYQNLGSYIPLSSEMEFFRLELGNWGANDKSVLQNYYIEALAQIRQILFHYKQQHFIFHSSYWQSGKLAATLALEFNTFFVHTVLSNALRKKIQGGINDDPPERIPWEREIFNQAKYILCSSKSEAEDIHMLYGVDYGNILVTGLAVDKCYTRPDYTLHGTIRFDDSLMETNATLNEMSSLSVPLAKNKLAWWTSKGFLYLGRLHPDKGLDLIIDAWVELYRTLGDKTPPLWIVGGTLLGIQEFRLQVERKWPQLPEWEAKHYIVWWGTLQAASVSALLLKSHAVVTHSRYESAGLVILESMARGIPVLATPYGYGRDLVRDWYNGFQIPYGDIKLMYNRMLMFCSQPYLAHLMGQNAQRTAAHAAEEFQFVEKHMLAYGFVEEIKVSPPVLKDRYSLFELCYQSLDTFPYLVLPAPQERISLVFQQHFETKMTKLSPLTSGSVQHFCAQTSSGQSYLVLRLCAYISINHIWNRFTSEPLVYSISEQIAMLKEFGSCSNMFEVMWESTGEGLVICTMPEAHETEFDTIWAITTQNHVQPDNIKSRWDALYKLVQATPQLHMLLPDLSLISGTIQRAIDAESNLPQVIFVPISGKKPKHVAALPFERAQITSLAGFDVYAKKRDIETSLSWENYNQEKIRIARIGWNVLLELWEKCRHILINTENTYSLARDTLSND